VAAAACVLVKAQDLPSSVDPERHRFRGARDIDGLVASSVEEEPVDGKAGGVLAAHDLAAVVDPVRRGLEDGVRMVDGGELASSAEEKPGPSGSTGWSTMQLKGGGSSLKSGCRTC
jgi:hypothetical protein